MADEQAYLGFDGKTNRNSVILIKKKNAIIVAAVAATIFVVSILITYFGKGACNIEKINTHTIVNKCESLVCQYESIIDSYHNNCSIIPTTTSVSTTTTTQTPVDYRLPKNLIPFFYELQLQPFIGPAEVYAEKAFTFNGQIHMHFTCSIPTNKIVFHALELQIDSNKLELTSNNDPSPPVLNKNVEFDKAKQFVIINLSKECKAGSDYKLTVVYSGVILTNLYGFYRGSYQYNGQTYYLASTHFEPVDARRAFPCWDEPALKAKFQLTIIRHKNFTSSLFNAPLINTTVHPTEIDWEIDAFNESLSMSTYLVAFVVSNFDTIKARSPKHNIDIEVVARPEAIRNGEGDFGLIDAGLVLDFFSDYFSLLYPMSKSTQVAIPNFNSGAMENWGLVTYREASLLYNNQSDTVANKHRVTQVVSHELAHQWFGDLVTMAWWNDLWLNEGFATWVENLGLDHTHPEWRDLDYFFVTKISVLVKDSLESSHPISVTVNNPSEIGSLFDSISYDKGASVIRMMNAFLTEKTFQKGVSNYLLKYQYNNTFQDNLWEELTQAAHADGTLDPQITVKDVMDTWTLKKGYPVVQVDRNLNELTITQKRFLLNPLNNFKGNNDYKWFVPFTFTTRNESDFRFEKAPTWLKPTDSNIQIQLNKNTLESDWIIANVKHAGFYRVNYDTAGWKLLIEQLKSEHDLVESTSRAQLIDDSFNLGRAEIIEQLVYLDLLGYLVNEQDPLPFQAAFYGLDYLLDMLSSDFETLQLYKAFYARLVQNSYSRIGWANLTDYNEINLQVSVMNIMCKTGSKECLDKSKMFYNNWISLNEQIPSDFKNIVYSTIAMYGGQADWLNLYNISLTTQSDAERLRILRALTKTRDYNLLEFLLKQSSNESIVKRQDELTVVSDIAANYIGKRLVFDYLDQNWNTLLSKYGDVSFTLPKFVIAATQNLNTVYDVARIERFLIDHPNTGIAASAFTEALETVTINIRWMQTNAASINKWLKLNQ